MPAPAVGFSGSDHVPIPESPCVIGVPVPSLCMEAMLWLGYLEPSDVLGEPEGVLPLPMLEGCTEQLLICQV